MKAIILLCLLAVPALAQPPPAPTSPVPLPQWFVDIDTDRKGEVSRDDFLKHRMKLVDELDANKDGKLSLEEFLENSRTTLLRRHAGRADPGRTPRPGAVGVPELRHQRQRLHRTGRSRSADPGRVQYV